MSVNRTGLIITTNLSDVNDYVIFIKTWILLEMQVTAQIIKLKVTTDL